MNSALYIFLGSGLGGLARWTAAGMVAARVGTGFPWGTLLVNVTGSFALGLFATLTGTAGRWPAGTAMREFFMIGVCGGYTTFSSFSHQTLDLAQRGEWFRAGGNAVLSMVLCLLAVWLGHALAVVLNPTKGG